MPSPKPCGPQSSGAERPHLSLSALQVDLGRPTGLRQSGGGRNAAAWWSSSGADRVRCPKNLNRNDLTFSETGKQPVMLLTVSFVVWLVYGIRTIFRRHQVSKASRRFATGDGDVKTDVRWLMNDAATVTPTHNISDVIRPLLPRPTHLSALDRHLATGGEHGDSCPPPICSLLHKNITNIIYNSYYLTVTKAAAPKLFFAPSPRKKIPSSNLVAGCGWGFKVQGH